MNGGWVDWMSFHNAYPGTASNFGDFKDSKI